MSGNTEDQRKDQPKKNEPVPPSAVAETRSLQQQQQPYRETIDGVIACRSGTSDTQQHQLPTSVGPTATAQLRHDASAVMPADVTQRLASSMGNAVTTKKASFAALKQNWETIINQGTRGFQNLSLCGAGADSLAQIAGRVPVTAANASPPSEDDPFAPIVLRHTHSLPLDYSHSLMDDDEPILQPVGLDSTRRSSSTPSSFSAFRSRSATSAFGPKLRTMPQLSGPDDRSAFTLPMQRSSYASSDSEIRYSSPFDPFFDDIETTAIEVTNMGAPSRDEKDKNEESGPTGRESAASKARRFMSNNFRAMRRKRRSGRENPARPPSTSSKSSDESRQNEADDETLSTKSSAGGKGARPKSSGLTVRQAFSGSHPSKIMRKAPSKEVDTSSPQKKISYQQLGSDVDEEDQSPKLSLDMESPTTIPSPSYQHFTDDRPNSRTESTDLVGGDEDDLNVVKIEVSSSAKPSVTPLVELSPNRDIIGATEETTAYSGSFSPTATVRSSVTQDTSGIGSYTSSGGRTQLSTVSETDREVMETNKAGKLARKLSQHNRKRSNMECGEQISIHSASTSSTNTHGYLALANSPVPPREGASMPVDRFFSNSRIPVTHSPSSSNSSASVKSTTVVKGDGSFDVSRASSDPSKKTDTSPITLKSSTSSQSTTEEPPRFVSYRMEHQTTGQSKGISTVSYQRTPDSSDRDSPARIVPVGYSEVFFEEAKPQASTLIRPGVKSRGKRFASRPPLSPAKGLRTPTTPPPPSSSPAQYQQLSPPNIVHQVDRTGDLSKPYVFRSGPVRAPVGDSKKQMVLVSPDSSSFRVTSTLDVIPDDESMASSYYNAEELARSRTYHQENSLQLARSADPPVVTPERGI